MKKRKRLIWRLYPSYVLIILISLVAVSGYASRSFRDFYMERTLTDLTTQSLLLKKQVLRHFPDPETHSLDQVCKNIGESVLTRITVMLSNGRVIGDSEKSPKDMDNHANRPEVARAISGETGTATRFSTTLQQSMMYIAIPLRVGPRLEGVLRTSIPLTAIDEELKFIQVRIAFGGLLIALLASGICFYVSRRISHPIEEMKNGADHFARGALDYRLPMPDTKEMAGLAEAMNQMAAYLADRIRTVMNQRNEIEAILSSMLEGVVAVDMDERVLSINQAALNILKVSSANLVEGSSIQEMIRSRKLHDFVQETLSSGNTAEGDVMLHHNGERILNVHSTPLCDSNDERIGTLVVLNDVTPLRHLENVRQDFVANVSHEIKTPLTAIKGFVETLRSGSVEDSEEADRFLGIVEKHVNRLNAIIEDLLQLSRIEQEDQNRQLQLEESPVREIIRSAIQVCQPKADEKQIQITLSCEEDIAANADIPLLEHAVVNLLDNAIKYSKAESKISVETIVSESETVIRVRDSGMGISREHLPRLFERFYRVDKARSRKLGGTGLGLAIVKCFIRIGV
ncbi:MAG: hypothetical protein B6245_23880 [Desulfobacteraceae bacterium 4572_88]|nr:MAG: hypothetical protein B6245_23880 [Desulfobacteraceae bacterium 4572_88]